MKPNEPPPEDDDGRAWHDVVQLISRAVEAHAAALTELRIAAGMKPSEAHDSVVRYGRRLAGQVNKAADIGARHAAAWHMTEGPPDG